jgi:predicted ATPase
MPMITRLHLTGYKSIHYLDLPLTPLTVLLGPNDAGKTSLLEALGALSRAVATPIDKVLAGDEALPVVAWRGSSPPAIRWEVELEAISAGGGGHGRYVLGVGEHQGTPVIREEQVSYNHVNVLHSTDGDLKDGSDQIVAKAPRRESGLALFGTLPGVPDLAAALSGTVRHELDARELARPSTFGPDSGDPALGSRGYGLASVLASMKLADYARFEKVEAGLRSTVPAIEHVVVRRTTVKIPTRAGVPDWQAASNAVPKLSRAEPSIDVPGDQLAFRLANGWEIPAHHASAGVLLFLAYLTLVHGERPPRTLLLEEPENGIHPRRLKTVLELLRRLTEGVAGALPTQVIMTTHSPYLVDFVRPEEVLVFRKGSGGATEVTRMADAPHLEDRLGEQQLGELWFNVGEDGLASAKKQQP